MSEKNFNLIVKTRNNLKSILEKRGYDVSTLPNETSQELRVLSENDGINFTINGVDANGRSKRCLIIQTNTVAGNFLKNIEEQTEDDHPNHFRPGIDEVLIIAFTQPSETAIAKVVQTSKLSGLQMDIIGIQNIQVNIFEHDLVPEQTVLSDIEKEEVMKRIRVKELKNLPQLRHSDIVCRLLGVRDGQIVKVVNKSPAMESVYYRAVSSGV